MKRRALIELTPLLDVMLLLLFAFIIGMQGVSDAKTEEIENLKQENIELTQSYDMIRSERDLLLAENAELRDEVLKFSNELDEQIAQNEEEKTAVKLLVEAFARLTQSDEYEISQVLKSDGNVTDALSEIVKADDIMLELYRYSSVINRFYFIDIELVGEENRVMINGEDTHITISQDDNIDADTRSEKAKEICDKLQENIDSRPGGDEMVMAILIVRDGDVYHYAHEIAWSAIGELELRTSGYRLYKTSYTYID